MQHTPIESKNDNGTQDIYRFANGYGASVVCHSGSYGGKEGLFELAVIKFTANHWDINYKTPITGNVIGWMDQGEVNETLDKIERLWRDGRGLRK